MIMSALLDILPGIALRVTEVPGMLSKMWQGDPGTSEDAPSAFRASQMNLVLQFGLATTPEEALRVFDQAIEFAQMYPCRIVALCPAKEASDAVFMEAKLFSQCYIGPSTRQMCCCEALMLGYPVHQAGFLENQVMVWLESDLPIYHWMHRVPARRIEEIYLSYLKLCTRVVFDSCIEGPDYIKAHWPKPDAVMDLAFARLLPTRQSIGQFLSGFEPAALVDGLAHVECRYAPGADGEAANLLHWQESCLEHCEKNGEHCDEMTFGTKLLDAGSPSALEVEWQYAGGAKNFLWTQAKECDAVRIRADFGKGAVDLPQHVKPMPRVRELAEALFF
jgi:hypothetical protein